MNSPTRFKPYAETRNSGIEWLGQIPAHWDAVRLKDVGSLVAGSGFPHEYQGVQGEELQFYKVGDLTASSDGVRMQDAPNSISRETAKQLRATELLPGALLWAKIGAGLFLNRRRITTRPCCIDNNMTAYVPNSTIVSTDWAFYWTSTLDFGELANPGAVPSLSEGYQATLPLVVPPSEEQQAIADFLDRETAKIDALVEKKERLIELLQEKRTALITHAVTKGLDPKVPMKDSGIEWLGQIPEHWETKPLKHLAYMKGRLGWQNLKADEYTDEGPFLVASEQFAGDVVEWERCPHVTQERYEMAPEIQIGAGDVLFMKDGAAMGKLAYVDLLPGPACLSSHLLLLRPVGGAFVTRFLYYVLGSPVFKAYMETERTGTTFFGFKQESMGNFPFLNVPVTEQQSIADFLDCETAKIDALIAKVNEAIERLKEYRTALISAAVTGKIDVRGLAGKGDRVSEGCQ